MTVIVAYGPTEAVDEADKDSFSEQLQELIRDAPPHDITIVLTEFNATLSGPAFDKTMQPVTGPVFAHT